jgi:hypothetical protein
MHLDHQKLIEESFTGMISTNYSSTTLPLSSYTGYKLTAMRFSWLHFYKQRQKPIISQDRYKSNGILFYRIYFWARTMWAPQPHHVIRSPVRPLTLTRMAFHKSSTLVAFMPQSLCQCGGQTPSSIPGPKFATALSE